MSDATERCTGFVCSYFEFLKLNVKNNDVKYAIVYLKKQKQLMCYFCKFVGKSADTLIFHTI